MKGRKLLYIADLESFLSQTPPTDFAEKAFLYPGYLTVGLALLIDLLLQRWQMRCIL
jgi:hypothetical protein